MATAPTSIPESEATKKLRELEEAKRAGTLPTNPLENPTVQIVERIVEKEVYPPDFKKVIEDARVEEKTKLYDRIKRAEAVENENATLRSRITDVESRNADLQRQIDELKKSGTTSKGGKSDGTTEEWQEMIQAAIVDTAAAMKKEMQPQLDALKAENAELKSKQVTASLSSVRDALIAEANGRIIQALVPSGPDENAIRVGVIAGKQAFENAVASVGASPVSPPVVPQKATAPSMVPSASGNQPASPMPIGRGEPTSPGADGTPAIEEGLQLSQEVKNLTPAQYKANRQGIRKKLSSIYTNAGNPLTR